LQRRTAVDEMIQRLRDAHARATADKATLGDLVIAANPIIDALPQLLDRLSAAEARVKVLEGERERLGDRPKCPNPKCGRRDCDSSCWYREDEEPKP
jgi:phosphoglycolate phosphatase-like HAD superfamily hydrolase